MPQAMRLDHFMATVYLGDRACKSITVDGWNERVTLAIDEISRVRSAAGTWDYYNDENVVDGALVFTEVKSFGLVPLGPLPSGYIDVESVQLVDDQEDMFLVKFNVQGTFPLLNSTRMQTIEIVAKGVHIADPRRPGIEVHE